MKLYMVPAAPNPTKVMLYIAERAELGTDLGIETVLVNTLKGEHKAPEHLARNPFGTVPVLEVSEGEYLLESLAIIQYLEDLFPGGSLLGTDPLTRGQARDLERIVEQKVAGPLSRYVHVTNSPFGLPADPKAAAEIEASLPLAFAYLERFLADGRPYLMGDQVSLADITLQSGCQFARFGKVDLISERKLLKDWDDRYRARPASQRVLKF
jgi:glutathione S-transferase